MSNERSRTPLGGLSANGPSNRIEVLIALFFIAALIWCARLVFLQVIVAEENTNLAVAQRTLDIEIAPRRGTIYDRNGKVLATSVDATTVYANPREISDVDATAKALADTLGGKAAEYKELIAQDSTFVYVKRKADEEDADALRKQELKGIYFLEDSKRVYPYGKVAGQILGFVGVDDEGLSGLEFYYNDILSGEPGRLAVQLGGTSKADGSKAAITIPGSTTVDEPAVDGQDIVISLDIDMQTYVEDRLAVGVDEIGGVDGNAVVMDASTGEIIAMASTPYFNPSNTSKVEEGATSAKSITVQFEPGSIFKTVSAMALLEADAVTINTKIDCPAYIKADEYYVSDAHERPSMTMDMRKIIADSSNVGISLAVEQYLGFDALYQKILAYGLNEPTGIDYPGEASGYLTDSSQWSHIQQYNVSFGQGVSVTPIQMVRFYGALANKGVACTPHFLISKPQTDETATYETEQIIKNKAAIPEMVEMLEAVVTEGTAKKAAIDGYRVVGKTGTAEFVDEDTNLYVKNVYNLDFVGFLPKASTPLVCFVGVNEVPYEGQTVEVFRDIMTEAISRYRIVQG